MKNLIGKRVSYLRDGKRRTGIVTLINYQHENAIVENDPGFPYRTVVAVKDLIVLK